MSEIVPWTNPGDPPCCCVSCTNPISEDQAANAQTLTAAEFQTYLAGGSVTFTFSFSYTERIALPGFPNPNDTNGYIQTSSVFRTSTHDTIPSIGDCAFGRFSFGGRASVLQQDYRANLSTCQFTFKTQRTVNAYQDSFCQLLLYLNNENGIYRVLPIIRGYYTYFPQFPITYAPAIISTEQNINFAPTVWQSQVVTFNGVTLQSGSTWSTPSGFACYEGQMNASIAVVFTPSAP